MVSTRYLANALSKSGWWEGGCDVIFNITEGGYKLIFFCFGGGGGGVLSKFLLDSSSFSAPPPDNYCTVP